MVRRSGPSRGSAVAKVRVYELAKEFGVESKAVMARLQEMGEFVRSASSTIEAPVVRRLKEELAAQQPKQAPAGKPGSKRPAEQAAATDAMTPGDGSRRGQAARQPDSAPDPAAGPGQGRVPATTRSARRRAAWALRHVPGQVSPVSRAHQGSQAPRPALRRPPASRPAGPALRPAQAGV